MPLALSLAGGARLALAAADPAYAKPIRNLVIVHGMLEDGAGARFTIVSTLRANACRRCNHR